MAEPNQESGGGMTGMAGIYRAQVTRVDDPEGLLRIRAVIPAISDKREYPEWVWPAFPVGGNNRRLRPEDPVWIAFENGREDRPVWIGTWRRVGDEDDLGQASQDDLEAHVNASNPHTGSASSADLSVVSSNLDSHTSASNPHSESASVSALNAHTSASNPHIGSASVSALTSHIDDSNPHSGSASTADLSAHTSASNPHSGSASTIALSNHTGANNPHSGSASTTALNSTNSRVTDLENASGWDLIHGPIDITGITNFSITPGIYEQIHVTMRGTMNSAPGYPLLLLNADLDSASDYTTSGYAVNQTGSIVDVWSEDAAYWRPGQIGTTPCVIRATIFDCARTNTTKHFMGEGFWRASITTWRRSHTQGRTASNMAPVDRIRISFTQATGTIDNLRVTIEGLRL